MNATRVFDDCWEAYKKCYVECYESGRLHAIDAGAFEKSCWKPDRKARPEDFLADFALAGTKALEGKERHSRLVLFRLYYLGQAPYASARHFLGLSEMGWVRWTEEIRMLVGEELERRTVLRKLSGIKEVPKKKEKEKKPTKKTKRQCRRRKRAA